MSAQINGINSTNSDTNIENNIIRLSAFSSQYNNTIAGLINTFGTNMDLTSVNSNIIPDSNNIHDLGSSNKIWANAYIRDISVTNISVSGNIILNICGGTITNINNLTAPASDYKITSTTRLYQEISGDISWNAVNGYYGLAKDVYPGLNPYSSGAKAVQTWTRRSQGVELNNWQSVCWSPELGIFVAVAVFSASNGSNIVMTSSNGTSWTSTSEGVDLNSWNSVCWSPQFRIFVAVASSGDKRVMYSTNGTTWTSTLQGVDLNSWQSVCWSPELGIFVAVANAVTNSINRVMYSTDGTNWTSTSNGVDSNSWSSVCWSPELGIFVAVADSVTTTNRVMTSTNGTSWTGTSQVVDLNSWQCVWQSVCWSPELGIFVAVATGGTTTNRVMTSTNGSSWTIISQGVEPNNWNSVCWSPQLGIFVAMATHGTNRVMSSTNGTTWTSISGGVELNSWQSVCWSSELGIFVAVSQNGDNRAMTSSLKGRPPTSYNVFDSSFNSIDENGNWTFTGNVNVTTINNLVIGKMGANVNLLGNIIPVIGPDGVMEISQYIDFHNTTTNSDYTFRIENISDEVLWFSGSIVPSVNNLQWIGSPARKWSRVYTSSLYCGTIDCDNLFTDTINTRDLVGTGAIVAAEYLMCQHVYANNPNGELGIGTSPWYGAHIVYLWADWVNGSSDDRLKHNEVVINNGLTVIEKLTPKFYQKTIKMLDASYNGDLSGHEWHYEAGLIAQELLPINDISYVVSGGDYYDSSNNLIQRNYSVNYNSVFVYGLAAIKELHAKVKDQETIINSLISRIEALENKP